jgi:RimJ/RimL family protein N-acetyltransferase
MQITFQPAILDEHFEQIIALQRQNLYTSLSAERQAEQGFVFAEHTAELLKSMASRLPQIIALANGKVIGYNLAMHVSMKDHLSSLAPIFAEFEKCVYGGSKLTDYRFVVGGQVCVDSNFRGMGLLSKLYNATKDNLPEGYELLVTEVSTRNTISLKAHLKMGFEVIHTYDDGIEVWDVIVWDMRD